ncbi:MAG: glutamate--cysteine ligase [Gammaproteobacteria bacterium]
MIKGGLKGIEKESLRIAKNGFIAQTPHPSALGSALTHPHITTDYSEALLEFITPPYENIQESLKFLENIHQFVYDNLAMNELLLATSMPCGIDGDESIPIAQYGNSNIGIMKHIYRRGLWYRYGRTMQAIAGIHFNYSAPKKLWSELRMLDKSDKPLDEYISDGYFGLIRNFLRQGWIVLYLFGASPAICKNFFKGREYLFDQFEAFDSYTLFHPYATSLRMSDIGYKSVNQAGLNIDYNHLDGYVASLTRAINTPFPEYEKIGVRVNGEYRQLNSNILQIENEFYSTIRPKQIARSGEKPTLALKRRGVLYVEVRSLDLNLYDHTGIDEPTTRFIEAFIMTCLLQDSPPCREGENLIINQNQLAVAHEGRKPGLELVRNGNFVPLREWAHEIIDLMLPVCKILDQGEVNSPYQTALSMQSDKIENPDLTPSAKILAGMRGESRSFASYVLSKSAEHEFYYRARRLDSAETEKCRILAKESHLRQQEIEASDNLCFDAFLEHYFSQN